MTDNRGDVMHEPCALQLSPTPRIKSNLTTTRNGSLYCSKMAASSEADIDVADSWEDADTEVSSDWIQGIDRWYLC